MKPSEDDEEIIRIEFTEEDCEAIASLDLAVLKSVVTAPQFEALQKFCFVNQATYGRLNQ